MTDPVLLVALGLAGFAIGSFLNVCIHRLPRGESIVSPASHCTHCGTPLRWYHNVPVISWIALRGRCAFCGARISPLYPFIEVLTAVLFILHGLLLGWTPLLAVRLLFVAALIVLAMIDLHHRILPNRITLTGVVAGLVFSLFLPPGRTAALIGALVGGGTLWLMGEAYFRLRGVEGMGMGDVKMLAMVGAFLGWKAVVVTLALASVAGAATGLVLMATGTGGLKYALPFGTFLAMGAIVASLAGDPLMDWYLSFYAL